MSELADLDRTILTHWGAFAEADISTERAIAMTADATGVSYGRVVDALQREHERRNQESRS